MFFTSYINFYERRSIYRGLFRSADFNEIERKRKTVCFRYQQGDTFVRIHRDRPYSQNGIFRCYWILYCDHGWKENRKWCHCTDGDQPWTSKIQRTFHWKHQKESKYHLLLLSHRRIWLFTENRIKYFAPADYNENSKLDLLIKTIIDKTVAFEKLNQCYLNDKKILTTK